mmetsp:Transcript_12623/g.46115  ORF Transcript_12623/g.46115 Transcript_12623/m.46115 type:complete len:474 (+) Transcript_12623:332-1753(+)
MSEKETSSAPPGGAISFAKAVKGTTRNNTTTLANSGDRKDRFTYAVTNLIGLPVELQVKNGSVYEGVFHASNMSQPGEFGVVLKMAKLVKDTNLREGQVKMAEKPQKVMAFASQDIVQLVSKNFQWLNHTTRAATDRSNGEDSFRTDAAIGAGRGGKDRELHRWVPDEDGTPLEGLASDATGSWDQFAENKRLFGVKSSFDENVYTTRLQKPKTEEDHRREREAERIAREIESEKSSNPHLLEERGQAVDAMGEEVDEEDKYSAVLTTSSYKPDAKAPNKVQVAENAEKIRMRMQGLGAGAQKGTAESSSRASSEQGELKPPPPAGPPPTSGAPSATNKSTLNPNAKEFKLSANAAAFVPRKTSPLPAINPAGAGPAFVVPAQPMMPGAPPMPPPAMVHNTLPVPGGPIRPNMPYTVMPPGSQQQFVPSGYGAMRSAPAGYLPQTHAGYGIAYQPQMYAPMFVPQQQVSSVTI